jgi:hypothetical protein
MESFFVCAGIALIAFALFFLLRDDLLFLRNTIIRTTGTVIGHRISTDDGSTFYMAQYQFLDQNGTLTEVTDTFGAARAKPDIGSQIKLFYPLGHANKARPPRLIMRASIYLFFGFVLVILLAKLFGFSAG